MGSVMNAQDAGLETLNRRARPGRPKSESKRRAIVEAAKQLFLAGGYERTSLENIAAAANVSKPTLYVHFRDKDDLHLQALRSCCEELTPPHLSAATHSDVGDRLLAVAHMLFELITKPEAIAVHRSIVGGARWFEQVSQDYWRAVPQRLFHEIVRMLCMEHERGAIDVRNPQMAASHFMSLVKGDLHEHLLFGRVTHLDPKAVAAHLREAIVLFHRAYAAPFRQSAKKSKRPPTQAATQKENQT